VREAHEWFTALPDRLEPKQNEIAARILKEIVERLRFLLDVGLEYLTLARASGTLSGGESQRIRLASQIGSGLTGVLYVLDEPSIGLHQRDNERLLGTLKRLRDLGNTVIVVEHDEDAILQADFVVDVGPRRGHPWRRDRRAGTAVADHGRSGLAHGQISHRRDERAHAGEAPQADEEPDAAASSVRAATISRMSRRRSRWAPSPASPACRAGASRRWSSTRSTRRSRAS
jgi:translation initiation factor RLI1